MTNSSVAIPGAVGHVAASDCQGREPNGNGCPATIRTSTGTFEARPYRPACMVHGCTGRGDWIIGLYGFRKVGDDRCIGLFCASHMEERIAALDPMGKRND